MLIGTPFLFSRQNFTEEETLHNCQPDTNKKYL